MKSLQRENQELIEQVIIPRLGTVEKRAKPKRRAKRDKLHDDLEGGRVQTSNSSLRLHKRLVHEVREALYEFPDVEVEWKKFCGHYSYHTDPVKHSCGSLF